MALLAYAFAAINFGTTLPTPMYALYDERMHFTVLTTTVIFATYAVGVLFALSVFGRWSDAVGRRQMLLAGAACAIGSAVVFVIAHSMPELLVGWLLSGLSAGIFTGTATAAVIESAPERWRDRAPTVATVANIGGLGLGPLLAGQRAPSEYSRSRTLTTFAVMSNLLGFPSPAEVAAQTPPDRDRAVDVIRIGALLGVVLGHTVMATSTLRDGVFVWDNLLTTSVVFQALTWVLQIMPLFFFAGAAVASWRAGGSWGGWLMKRCLRLYRPVFYYLAFWIVTLAVLHRVLPVHVYEPVAGVSIQLLWFLGAYVLMLAAMPLLSRIDSVAALAASVAGLYLLILLVDVVRLHVPAMAWLGYLNMTVWLIPGMFGVAYRRRLLDGRAALFLGGAMLGVNLALLAFGPYELSLVGIEGQRLANMTPPSLLLAGHAIMMCAFAIAAAPAIDRWAHRPRVWWLSAIGNSGAMTLYLWHMPALLLMHLAFDYAGLPRYPGQPNLLALSVIQLAIMVVAVAALFVALRPLENRPLPGWDGPVALTLGPRSAVVGLLLCIAAAATLMSVKWGLKADGIYCVAVMLAALVGARLLSYPKTPVSAPTVNGSTMTVK